MKKEIYFGEEIKEVELINMNKASVTLRIEDKNVFCSRRVFNTILNSNLSNCSDYEIIERGEHLWLAVWEPNIF